MRFICLCLSFWLIFGSGSAFSQAQPTPNPGGDTSASEDLIRAVLMKEAIKIIETNIKAAGRESGELDKLIRALSGISVNDIKQYGLCGGPNSEMRKQFGSLC